MRARRLWLAAGWLVWTMGAAMAEETSAPANPLPLPQALADSSPYGVCAHVSRGGEHTIAREEFAKMREAGIEWARTDFDWSGVEPKPGEWNFSHLDETMDWAEAAGIKILPILDYDVKWASPAYKHLDKWGEYVRQVVTRYKDRIRVWEVWNEENLDHMWREKPDGANYVPLLKTAYETIKAIDPKLTVLFGGTAGIPYEYIEAAYQAGAAPYFDVLNIHPYRYPNTPEQRSLVGDVVKLRELMGRYNDANKPLWITEIGWPTHGTNEFVGQLIQAGLAKLVPADATVAVLDDPEFPDHRPLEDDALVTLLGAGKRIQRIKLGELAALDPARQPALLLSPSEGFPADYFAEIEKYVRAGGALVLTEGLPMYYAVRKGADGVWKRDQVNDEFCRKLHISWSAWWTDKTAPEKSSQLAVTPEFKDLVKIGGHMSGTRFLTGAALAEGDQFMPIIGVKEGEFSGATAAVYKFGSDLKGGAVVLSFMALGSGSTEAKQGQMLPRAYLLAGQAGVERMFWYEFQATEQDPTYNEAHFGMTHKDLSPKPAYTAMQALTRARPVGSKRSEAVYVTGEVYHLNWTRPDGKAGWALWTVQDAQEVTLKVAGEVAEAFDNLGQAVEVKVENGQAKVKLSGSVLYLIGPSQVELAAN